jgi:hypothetical protein
MLLVAVVAIAGCGGTSAQQAAAKRSAHETECHIAGLGSHLDAKAARIEEECEHPELAKARETERAKEHPAIVQAEGAEREKDASG